MCNVASRLSDVAQSRRARVDDELNMLVDELRCLPMHVGQVEESALNWSLAVGDDPVWLRYLARLVWLCGHHGFDRNFWYPALLLCGGEKRHLAAAVMRYAKAGRVPPPGLGFAMVGPNSEQDEDYYPRLEDLTDFMDLLIDEVVQRDFDARLKDSLGWLFRQQPSPARVS